MTNVKRCICIAATILLLLGSTSMHAAEAEFPSKPIRLVVPFAPGGGQDMVARLVGGKLSEAFRKQVVVDNRPGGGGVVASEIVANSAPDGHTLYLIEGGFAVAPSLHTKLPFDPIKSFTPIARVSVAPGAVVVNASVPAQTIGELLALAKAQPGKLDFGSAGIGTSSHLAGELLKMLAGIDIVHVAYKGSASVTSAMLNGEVAMALINPVSVLPHVKAGKLKFLAVTTAKRVPAFPEVPTVAESGVPGFENVIWNGMVVRAGTPLPTVQRLTQEIVKVSLVPGVKEHLARDGAVMYGEDTPRAFAQFLQAEIAKWNKVVKKAGIQPN